MLEPLLAIAVLIAVLLFGALMAAGNERQRKAIDRLNASYSRWAEHDLIIKRAVAARQVHIEDPLAWLEAITTKLFGFSPNIITLEPWKTGEAKALVATCPAGRKLVVTPIPPLVFRKLIRLGKRKGAAAAIARTSTSLLGNHPGNVPCYELNIITAGTFFDIEAGQAWEQVFHEKPGVDRFFLFDVPAERVH